MTLRFSIKDPADRRYAVARVENSGSHERLRMQRRTLDGFRATPWMSSIVSGLMEIGKDSWLYEDNPKWHRNLALQPCRQA
jgi:hypothetical protein